MRTNWEAVSTPKNGGWTWKLSTAFHKLSCRSAELLSVWRAAETFKAIWLKCPFKLSCRTGITFLIEGALKILPPAALQPAKHAYFSVARATRAFPAMFSKAAVVHHCLYCCSALPQSHINAPTSTANITSATWQDPVNHCGFALNKMHGVVHFEGFVFNLPIYYGAQACQACLEQ